MSLLTGKPRIVFVTCEVMSDLCILSRDGGTLVILMPRIYNGWRAQHLAGHRLSTSPQDRKLSLPDGSSNDEIMTRPTENIDSFSKLHPDNSVTMSAEESSPHTLPILPQPSSPLLSLPPELRNQIYTHTLLSPSSISITPTFRPPPLHSTSRQVRSETRALYYLTNSFIGKEEAILRAFLIVVTEELDLEVEAEVLRLHSWGSGEGLEESSMTHGGDTAFAAHKEQRERRNERILALPVLWSKVLSFRTRAGRRVIGTSSCCAGTVG